MVWLLSLALAAEIHLDVAVGDWAETVVAEAGEPLTKTYGPLADGKTKLAYEVTWPPAAHSVVDNGYPLEVMLCRVWAKGKKKGRDCVTAPVIARPESAEAEQVAGEVDKTTKWAFSMKAWATGADIPSTEMPMEARPVP
jgi:hypothetical protein